MRAGLSDASGNDVCNDIARLDERKQQLADLSQSTDGVEVSFSQSSYTARIV